MFPCHFNMSSGEGAALAPGNGLANKALWSFIKRFKATFCLLIFVSRLGTGKKINKERDGNDNNVTSKNECVVKE